MKPRLYKKNFLVLAAAVMLTAPTQTLHAARGLWLPGYQSASVQETQRPTAPSTTAQTSKPLEDLIKKLTEAERTALNRPEDPHGRIKTYVRLMEARLNAARAYLNKEQYTATDEQLEVYAGLVDEAGRFLEASVRPRDKANKTLEKGLHEQLRVLEGIRRDVTVMHLELAEKALAAANRVRRQALNALIGDGKILKEPPGTARKTPQEL